LYVVVSGAVHPTGSFVGVDWKGRRVVLEAYAKFSI
jgi:hypothetical protein